MCLLIRPHWDHGSDCVPSKPRANARIAVSLVPSHGSRSLAWTANGLRNAYSIHDEFELSRFVPLPGCHLSGEGQAVAVSDQVEFAAKSAARAAQTVVFWLLGAPFFPAPAAARLARTLLPSTHHRSQSMHPSESRRICRASSKRSQVPSFRHRLNQSYTVCQGPNRLGRSRHGAPVRTIQRIPSTIWRRSLRGRPKGLPSGNNGAMNSHCSSVSAWRFILSPPRTASNVPGRGIVNFYRMNPDFSDRA